MYKTSAEYRLMQTCYKELFKFVSSAKRRAHRTKTEKKKLRIKHNNNIIYNFICTKRIEFNSVRFNFTPVHTLHNSIFDQQSIADRLLLTHANQAMVVFIFYFILFLAFCMVQEVAFNILFVCNKAQENNQQIHTKIEITGRPKLRALPRLTLTHGRTQPGKTNRPRANSKTIKPIKSNA